MFWLFCIYVIVVAQLLSPVLHYLLEFNQIHVHWVDDAIQPSHSLPPSSPFCFQSFPASGSFPMSHLFTSVIHKLIFSSIWFFIVSLSMLYDGKRIKSKLVMVLVLSFIWRLVWQGLCPWMNAPYYEIIKLSVKVLISQRNSLLWTWKGQTGEWKKKSKKAILKICVDLVK